jgi:transcriptional regulator with GAF, ATPase, and Fis domain
LCLDYKRDKNEIRKLERMEDHADRLRAALSSERNLDGLIGESAPIGRLSELIGKIGLRNSPALLVGETGTEKKC